jgi:hypothetical protein
VRDLLWGAAGENPKGKKHHPSHHSHPGSHGDGHGHGHGAQRAAELRGGAALSTREAVARCASRLTFSLAPGTPTTYAGALEPSSQVSAHPLVAGARIGFATCMHRHASTGVCSAARTMAALGCASLSVECSNATLPHGPPTLTPITSPVHQARVVTEPHPPFRVVHVNRAWEQLCLWRASDVLGQTLAVLQGPDTDPQALAQVRGAALNCARTQVTCVNYR